MPGIRDMHLVKTCVTLAALGFFFAAVPARAGSDDPATLFREREAKVRTILNDPKIDVQKKRGMLADQISDVFDFAELARRSLSGQWNKLSVSQRDQFAGTLKELIEISILSKLRPNKDYSVEVDAASVKGQDAHLPAMVATPAMMPGDEVALEFMLHRSGQKGWVIYDMIIDEVSLLNNYRQQFRKILSEQPFEFLMQQMQQKLEFEKQG